MRKYWKFFGAAAIAGCAVGCTAADALSASALTSVVDAVIQLLFP